VNNCSELVQLKLNIETSVGESTPTEAEYGGPLPLEEVGVLRLDKQELLLQLNVVEAKLVDLKARWPAHSVHVTMVTELEDLEEERDHILNLIKSI